MATSKRNDSKRRKTPRDNFEDEAAGEYLNDEETDAPALGEDVPERLALMAGELYPLIKALAFESTASKETIERGNQLYDLLLAATQKPVPAWQDGLIDAFKRIQDTFPEGSEWPVGAKADTNAVDLIVELAGQYVGWDWLERLATTTDPFVKSKHRKNAARALRAMRLAKRDERPGGRSKKCTPFAAAREFAHALGLPFPERARNLARASKSGRRVS